MGMRFVKGPISLEWVEQCCRLGGGAAKLAWMVAYRSGIAPQVRCSRSLVARFGLSPNTFRRALKQLEDAGLVTVDRRNHRSPVVVIRSQ